jgi:hypothetical protein
VRRNGGTILAGKEDAREGLGILGLGEVMERRDYNHAAEQAIHALTYYFMLLFMKQGLAWDQDNNAEIRGIVENIIDATVRETSL